MRPIRKQQSALRTPLNAVLGTEANVRILRVVALASAPLSSGNVAQDAALQPSGVRRALDRLVETGILERIGSGRQRLVQLRPAHPLVSALRALFEAERLRAEQVFETIQRHASTLSPPPRSVWVQGPVAEGVDRIGDPVQVCLLADGKDLDRLAAEFRAALVIAESELDVTIEVRGLTMADLQAIGVAERGDLQEAVSVFGLTPTVYLDTHRRRGRTEDNAPVPELPHADARLLRLAAAIAQKLEHDPALIEKAQVSISRRVRNASEGEKHELEEWEHLLRAISLPRLRKFLIDGSPRAARLRQTLPFLEVLSQEERERIMNEVEP